MKVLDGLLYTNEHDWVKVEGETAYLGISDYAQKALGSIVYIELPEIGTEYNVGDTFATIESVKAASDSNMPVDGKIIEINESTVDSPEIVNQDPYKNWLIRFEISDKSQLEGLMQPKVYEDFCSKEE